MQTDPPQPEKPSCLRDLNYTQKQVQKARITRRLTRSVYYKPDKKKEQEENYIYQTLLIQLKPREEASPSEIAALNGSEAHFLPYIEYAYPSLDGQKNNFLPSLFYPDFTCPWRTNHDRAECSAFTVVLTDEKCNRSYAYCYKFRLDDDAVRKQANILECRSFGLYSLLALTPFTFACFFLDFDDEDASNPLYFIGNSVLVFISHFPVADILMTLAQDCVGNLKRKRQTIEEICSDVMKLYIKNIKDPKDIKLDEGEDVIRLRDRENVKFSRPQTSTLIEKLGVETTVYIFMSLLAERRILVTGENVKSVSDTVQMFSRLLAPLDWPHTLIPIIPDTLIDLCQNPTPYLCGTMRHNLHKLNRILLASSNITGEEEDITIIDTDLGIFCPNLNFNRISKKEKLNKLFIHGREMGFSKKMILDLVTLLQSVFPFRNAEKATIKVEDRIMIWYAKNFGHYRRWTCATSLLSSKNKKLFAQNHPVPETRDFLHWFVESGIFQNFVYGALEKKYFDPMHNRFEEIRKKHAPPAKTSGATNTARRFFYKIMHK